MSTYSNHIAAGNCGRCGKPRDGKSKSLCNSCLAVSRDKSRKRRESSETSGTCPCCNARPKVAGKSRCAECLASGRASAKRKAAQRKRDGLCPSCGKPAMPGKTVCEECSKKMSVVSAERYHERRAEGKCNYCDNPPVPGRTMCQYHLDQTQEYREELKREVMEAYGGAKCAHAGCNETDLRYLEIDHIGGGGKKHTDEIGGGGHNLYGWLKRNNYPTGFRVLCRTHNNAAHVEKCRTENRRVTTSPGN